MDIRQFSLDKNLSEQGQWFQLGPEARIKMRSISSAHARGVRVKLEAPYKAIKNAGQDLPKEIDEQITKDQFAQSLIVEWEGLKDGEEPFPYSIANVYLALEDEGFADFLVKILVSPGSFKKLADEDEVKQ